MVTESQLSQFYHNQSKNEKGVVTLNVASP
jgi:hypothetical protein